MILVNGRLSENSFRRWRYLPASIGDFWGGSIFVSRARRPTPSG